MNPEALVINQNALSLLPEEICRQRKVVPLDKIQNNLLVAMANPSDAQTLDDIRFMTGLDVQPVAAAEVDIVQAIDRHYGQSRDEIHLLTKLDVPIVDSAAATGAAGPRDSFDPLTLDEPVSPVVKAVDGILRDAVRQGVSHIHFDPLESGLRVRFRVDGVLQERMTIPAAVSSSIVSRVKILARLDIAERRLPQDGRVQLSLESGRMDALVCTLPTGRGERIVMTLVDRQVPLIGLDHLGLPAEDLERLKRAASVSSGLVLVAGPPRSGRSTTLYSLLGYLNSAETCILTAEDPIDRFIDGVGQIQIRPDIGYGYSVALKAFMRQDPDVIMIQEIPDAETANAVLQTVVDGYLMLAAVEANDAAGALLSLKQLSTPALLAGSTIRCVLAQRLVRRTCRHCKTASVGSKEQLARVAALDGPVAPDTTFFRGAGCAACGQTGYFGRLPVCEMLMPSEATRAALLRDASLDELRRICISEGMTTFAQHTMQRAIEGKTTLDECCRIAAETEFH